MPGKQSLLGIGIVLLSAILIGLAPNAAKVAYQEGADPLAVITFRTITEPMFAIFLAIILLQEWLSPLQWLGVAIVIGSLLKFESAEKPSASA